MNVSLPNLKTVKNIKFKPEYILNNELKMKGLNITQRTTQLIKVLRRDGIKCHCCNGTEIHFEIVEGILSSFLYKNNKKILMTLDHDILKCLGGKNVVDNYHALCENCNKLRKDSFAEYKEFKEWYDGEVLKGKTPAELHYKNYCNIDFNAVARATHMEIDVSGGVPIPMQIGIKKHLKNKNTIVGSYINPLFIRIDAKKLNEFLSELIYETASNYLGKKITQKSIFNIAHEHNKVNTKPSNYVKNINKIYLRNLQKLITTHQAQNKVLEVIKQQNERTSFWKRISSLFSTLFN